MFDMSDASCRRGDCVMQVCLIPRAVMVKASSCFPVSLKDGSLGRESSEKNVAFKPIKFHDSPKKNISPETRNRERQKNSIFLAFSPHHLVAPTYHPAPNPQVPLRRWNRMSITMPGRRPYLWGFCGISFDVTFFLLVEDLDDGQNRQNPDIFGFLPWTFFGFDVSLLFFFPVQFDECKRLWIRICRGTLMDEISGIGRRIELLNLNSSRVSPSGWFSLVCRSTTARRVVMKSWTTSSIATWNRYTPQV